MNWATRFAQRILPAVDYRGSIHLGAGVRSGRFSLTRWGAGAHFRQHTCDDGRQSAGLSENQ